MTDLQTLLFGKPHPVPTYIPPGDGVGNYGKRSDNYGKAVANTREAVKLLAEFTVKDIAATTGMDRGTVNRSLIKLCAEGLVRKATPQTAGSRKESAIWERVIPQEH